MASNETNVNEKGSHESERTATVVEDARPRKTSFVDVDEDKLSAAFENPLGGIPKAQLLERSRLSAEKTTCLTISMPSEEELSWLRTLLTLTAALS